MEPKPVASNSKQDIEWSSRHEATQSALIAEVGRLESRYGITSERLIDLYGEGVLDIHSPESAAVDRWTRLCDTLTTTEKSIVALVRLHTELDHSSYSPGATVRFETRASVIIITDPHNAYLAFSGNGVNTRIFLGARGYRLLQSSSYANVQPRLDDLTGAPQVFEESIASSVPSFSVQQGNFGDMLDMIIASDSLQELYDTIEQQRMQLDSDPRRIDIATEQLRRATSQHTENSEA